jgi:ferredoxin-NADP reductase
MHRLRFPSRTTMIHDTALPASLTAVHLALAMLRRHRAGTRAALSPFVLPSFGFAITPWLWPAPLALAGFAAGHLAWMLLSEVIAPPRRAPRAATPAATRDAPVRALTPPAPRATGTAPAGASFAVTSVLAVIPETPEIRTFRLARPQGFEFTPGQFLTVKVQIDGKPHIRCYSLCSSPDASGYLEISVRRQGRVSSMLHASLRPGSQVSIGRPAGAFVYPANDDRPVALIAGGIGITPLLCMLRHGASADPSRPITLLYSVRRQEDVAFADELQVLSARHPQLKVEVTLTQPAGAVRIRHGRIDAAMIHEHVVNPAQTIFCLCGPPEMLTGMTALLRSLGVPPEQIRAEQFETAIAAASLHAASPAPAPAPAAGPFADERPQPSAAGGRYRVVFAASQRETSTDRRTSLLETAEAAGVAIASSCRAGVCQSCRTRLTGGDADCRSDMLDPDDRAQGFILPCVSWATADCVLDA